ncbi:MAG: NDP-sugar synthase [Cyanobacteria bacterium SZAS LIN-5]|nr:NDP-sugar synthase [Cyanobacteria bacterium SZAS LIN-5]
MKAMVLAAGVGSRLEPLTTQVPKPIVPVANIPVMEHLLKLLAKHDFTDICANLHYMPEKLIEYFNEGKKFGVNLTFKTEERLSGDAGGVRACREFLQGDTFIVIMGDLIADTDLTSVIKEHKKKKALASIAIKEMDDVSRFGVVVTDENGFITGFQEKPSNEEALSKFISTGIYVLEPEIFDHIPATGEYGFGRQLFPTLVAKKLPVLGVKIEGYWSDVGCVAQYREANFDALSGKVKVDLPGKKVERGNATVWVGDGSQIDDTAKFEGLVLLGRNCKVQPGATFGGTVVLGDNVTVEAGAHVVDSIVWSDSVVGANSEIRNSVIGYGCTVSGGAKYSEVATVNGASEETAAAATR